MKYEPVKFNKEGDIVGEWTCADWKDTEGLLEALDDRLRQYGLELIQGEAGDDNWWIKLKRIPKLKAILLCKKEAL
jgi:hypothetical protein